MSDPLDPKKIIRVENMIPPRENSKENIAINGIAKPSSKISKPLGSFGTMSNKESISVDSKESREYKNDLAIDESAEKSNKESSEISRPSEASSKSTVNIDESSSHENKSSLNIQENSNTENKQDKNISLSDKSSKKSDVTVEDALVSERKSDKNIVIESSLPKKIGQVFSDIFNREKKSEEIVSSSEKQERKTTADIDIESGNESKSDFSVDAFFTQKAKTEKEIENRSRLNKKNENDIADTSSHNKKSEDSVFSNKNHNQKDEEAIEQPVYEEKKIEVNGYKTHVPTIKETSDTDVMDEFDSSKNDIEKEAAETDAVSSINAKSSKDENSNFIYSPESSIEVKDGSYNFASPSVGQYKRTTTLGRTLVKTGSQENSDFQYDISENNRSSDQEKTESVLNKGTLNNRVPGKNTDFRSDSVQNIDRPILKPNESEIGQGTVDSSIDSGAGQNTNNTTDFNYSGSSFKETIQASDLKKNDENGSSLDYSTTFKNVSSNISEPGKKDAPNGNVATSINTTVPHSMNVADFRYSNTPSDFASSIQSIRVKKATDSIDSETVGKLNQEKSIAYVSPSSSVDTKTQETQANFKNYTYQEILQEFANRVGGVDVKKNEHFTADSDITSSSIGGNNTRSSVVSGVEIKMGSKYNSNSNILDPKGFGFPSNTISIKSYDVSDDGDPVNVINSKEKQSQETSDFGYVYKGYDSIKNENRSDPKLDGTSDNAHSYSFPEIDSKSSEDQKYYYKNVITNADNTTSNVIVDKLKGGRKTKIDGSIDSSLKEISSPESNYSDKIELAKTGDKTVKTSEGDVKIDYQHNVKVTKDSSSSFISDVTTVPMKSVSKGDDITPNDPNSQKNSSFFVYTDFLNERRKLESIKVEDSSDYDNRDAFTKVAGDWRLQDFTSAYGITNIAVSRASELIGANDTANGHGNKFVYTYATKESDSTAKTSEVNALDGINNNGKIKFGTPVTTANFPKVLSSFMPVTNSINTIGGTILANAAVQTIDSAISDIAVKQIGNEISNKIGDSTTINNALYNQLRREILITGTRFLVTDVIQNAVLYGGKPENKVTEDSITSALQDHGVQVKDIQHQVEKSTNVIQKTIELGINESSDYIYKYGRLPGYIAKYFNMSAGQEFKNLDEYRKTIREKITSVTDIAGIKIPSTKILTRSNEDDVYNSLVKENSFKNKIIKTPDKSGLKESDMSSYSQLLYPTDYRFFKPDKNGEYDFKNYNNYFNINKDVKDSYNTYDGGIDNFRYSRFFTQSEKYNFNKWSNAKPSLRSDYQDLKKGIDKQREEFKKNSTAAVSDDQVALYYPYPDEPDALKITFSTFTDDDGNIWRNTKDDSNDTITKFDEKIKNSNAKSLFAIDSFEKNYSASNTTSPSMHQMYKDLFFRNDSSQYITIDKAKIVSDDIIEVNVPDSNVSGKKIYFNELNKNDPVNPSSDNLTSIFYQITDLNDDGSLKDPPAKGYSTNINYVSVDYSDAQYIMKDVDYTKINTVFQRNSRNKSNVSNNANPYFGFSIKKSYIDTNSLKTVVDNINERKFGSLTSSIDKEFDSSTKEGEPFAFKDSQARELDESGLTYLDSKGYTDLYERNSTSGLINTNVKNFPTDKENISQFSPRKYVMETYETNAETTIKFDDKVEYNYGSYKITFDTTALRKARTATTSAKSIFAANDSSSTYVAKEVNGGDDSSIYKNATRYFNNANSIIAADLNAFDVAKEVNKDGKISVDVFLHYGKEGTTEDVKSIRNKYDAVFKAAKFYDSDVGSLVAYTQYNNANSDANKKFVIPFQFNPEISGESRDSSYVSISTIGRVNDFNIWSSTGSRSISFKTTYFVTGVPNEERTYQKSKNEYYGWMNKWTDTYIQQILNYYRALMLPITYDKTPHPPIVMFKWNSFLSTKLAGGTWGKSNWIVKNLSIDPKYEYGYDDKSKIPRGWDVSMSLVEVYDNWQSYQTGTDITGA